MTEQTPEVVGFGHQTEDERIPTIAKIATVTVMKPVDGTKRRKPRKQGKRQPKAVDTHAITVRPDVLAAAKAAQREGERLVIVSEEEVWLR